MIDSRALPRFRKRLALLRHRPESPRFFSRRLVERRQESAHALIPAGDSRNHQIADHQRSRRRVVIQLPVRHHRIPQHRAREPVQRDEVRVIHHHEQPIARNRHSAVEPSAGISVQILRPIPQEVPNLPPRPRVERIAFVPARDVHQPTHHHRRRFRWRSVRQIENPLRC